MSWDRNNLAPHALPSFLCDSLSPSSAGLNLGRHLGQSGTPPMVAGNGPNTSLSLELLCLLSEAKYHNTITYLLYFCLRVV